MNWRPVMNWHPMLGVFLRHTQCSQDKLGPIDTLNRIKWLLKLNE